MTMLWLPHNNNDDNEIDIEQVDPRVRLCDLALSEARGEAEAWPAIWARLRVFEGPVRFPFDVRQVAYAL